MRETNFHSFVMPDSASATVLKFNATYSMTEGDDSLPELVNVEMEQEWIEEKLPAVAEDFNSGLSVVYYQINDRLSVTIKKLTLVIGSQSSDAS